MNKKVMIILGMLVLTLQGCGEKEDIKHQEVKHRMRYRKITWKMYLNTVSIFEKSGLIPHGMAIDMNNIAPSIFSKIENGEKGK